MARLFEARYGQSFDEFRKAVLREYPAADVEQDYFDWELAVTGIADMEEEIVRLKKLTAQPVSYTHLRAHETVLDLVCRLLLEKKTKLTS